MTDQELYKKIYHNFKRFHPTISFRDFLVNRGSLSNCFKWEKTAEGYDFWNSDDLKFLCNPKDFRLFMEFQFLRENNSRSIVFVDLIKSIRKKPRLPI